MFIGCFEARFLEIRSFDSRARTSSCDGVLSFSWPTIFGEDVPRLLFYRFIVLSLHFCEQFRAS